MYFSHPGETNYTNMVEWQACDTRILPFPQGQFKLPFFYRQVYFSKDAQQQGGREMTDARFYYENGLWVAGKGGRADEKRDRKSGQRDTSGNTTTTH